MIELHLMESLSVSPVGLFSELSFGGRKSFLSVAEQDKKRPLLLPSTQFLSPLREIQRHPKFVDRPQTEGRYGFSSVEVQIASKMGDDALRKAIRR